MANLQSIIDRSEQLALTGGDGFASPLIDSTLTAQAIFPHAVRYVLNKMAATGEDMQEIARPIVIEIIDGIGEIPDSILKDTFGQAQFYNHPFISMLELTDYQRNRFDGQLSYFTVVGKNIYFSDGVEIFSGNLEFVIPQIPELPTDITQPVLLSGKIVEDVILTIADVLRGTMPLSGLMRN